MNKFSSGDPATAEIHPQLVRDLIARWTALLAEHRAQDDHESARQTRAWLFGAKLTLDLLGFNDLAQMAAKAESDDNETRRKALGNLDRAPGTELEDRAT